MTISLPSEAPAVPNLGQVLRDGASHHQTAEAFVMALCAMMAGAEGWDDIEAWGEANEERLRPYLELRNGIPGHDTIRRVFEAIDPKRLEVVLLEWIGHVCPALGQVVAFREDASAVHLRQAAANLGIVRKLAPNLFRLDTGSKLSLPRKRKNAAWKPDYLFDLLGLQPISEI